MTPIAKLIQNNGQPLFGQFPQGVQELNYQDYDLRTAMDKKTQRLGKKWRFNQFQFISFIAPDFIVGLAIVDLKLVSNAFYTGTTPKAGNLKSTVFLQPLAHHTAIALFPIKAQAIFQKGKTALKFRPAPRLACVLFALI